MKRLWIYILGAVLVIAAAGALVFAFNTSRSHNDKTTSADESESGNATGYKPKAACSIFTLAGAKQLLGDTAKGGENATSTSSDDLAVSTCSYNADSGSNAPISSRQSASLLARSPKTAAGATSNRNQFGSLRPKEVQDVSGYGDSAYWDAQRGQLNILKNGTWYILSYGPITPTDRTLDQSKRLANILNDKL